MPGIYLANSTTGEHAGYTTSILGNYTVRWIRKVAKGAQPWMVTIGNRASHAPFEPAPWYREGEAASAWIDNLTAPRTPDYNASCPDFHWLISHQLPLTDSQAASTDGVFRDRWRSLMSVDDEVAGIVGLLDELGLVDSTYILITSDHGE